MLGCDGKSAHGGEKVGASWKDDVQRWQYKSQRVSHLQARQSSENNKFQKSLNAISFFINLYQIFWQGLDADKKEQLTFLFLGFFLIKRKIIALGDLDIHFFF